MEKIFVIIPAYNEERTIAQVVRSVKKKNYEVVVIDDGSMDLTAKLSEEAGAQVLKHVINRGQGAAINTGIRYALKNQATIIVTFDADGQFEAEEIENIIAPIISGEAEAVLGSRFLEKSSNVPRVRKIILKLGIIFTRIISGIEVSDTHNGFRALSRQAAQKIEISEDMWAHASEIIDEIARKKIKFKEIPVTVNYSDYARQKGQSSLNSIKIALRVFWSKLIK